MFANCNIHSMDDMRRTCIYSFIQQLKCSNNGGGNVSDLALARNFCLARMLPGEAELVSELTGLPGKGKKCKAL